MPFYIRIILSIIRAKYSRLLSRFPIVINIYLRLEVCYRLSYSRQGCWEDSNYEGYNLVDSTDRRQGRSTDTKKVSFIYRSIRHPSTRPTELPGGRRLRLSTLGIVIEGTSARGCNRRLYSKSYYKPSVISWSLELTFSLRNWNLELQPVSMSNPMPWA